MTTGYDLIGDIHGHAATLERLLERLGYRCRGGVWGHSDRTAVFVGDFIDRGPQIRETLYLVRRMIDAGNALTVMGNHEYNAVAFHIPRPDEPTDYLRRHNEKNLRQHRETLTQLSAAELGDFTDWFRTLPVALELPGFRVVHACWSPPHLAVLQSLIREHGRLTDELMYRTCRRGTPEFAAAEVVLKGPEAELPDGVRVADKDGHIRSTTRLRWFGRPPNIAAESQDSSVEDSTVTESRDAGMRTPGPTSCGRPITWRQVSFPPDERLPDVPVPAECLAAIPWYGEDESPVFFGHYWLPPETSPTLQAANACCLDYSVAKGGALCAYRFDCGAPGQPLNTRQLVVQPTVL